VPARILKQIGLIAAISALSAYAVVFFLSSNTAPIHSDGYSYYVYLPAWFIHNDPTLQRVADDCCGGTFPAFTNMVRYPLTGRWVSPYPIGVAIMIAPFFALAHALTRWSNLPPDGFSLYYQHAAGLSGVSAFVAGLLFLRAFLRRWFTDGVVLATLVIVTFGTNLFHYATYDSTFSHAFSFMLVAALLDLTDRWWTDPSWPLSLALSVCISLIFLTRHPNVVVACIPALWNPAALRMRFRRVVAMGAISAFCITPQLAIYRQASGRWFLNVYALLGRFDFAAPRIWQVLFSVQKGLFFWSPVLLVAVVGFATARSAIARRTWIAALLVFAVQTYVIASWSHWQFGASFGHRGFTDILPLAAIYIADFCSSIARRPRAAVAAGIVIAALVALSCAQMIQYWLGILPFTDTTWEQYRTLFLRFE